MARKESKDEKGRKTSPKSKVRVKRTRRRIYESVSEEPSTAGSPKEIRDRDGEEALRQKIRHMQAKHLVKNYMMGSMGAGLIPVPIIDVAAISGVQLKMLHRLSNHYDIPFMENRAKAFIAALVGGIGPAALAAGALGTFMKALPGIGSILGSIKISVLSGASAYAVGMVFIQHFESGGTFLDFHPERARHRYVKKFEEGKNLATEMADKE